VSQSKALLHASHTYPHLVLVRPGKATSGVGGGVSPGTLTLPGRSEMFDPSMYYGESPARRAYW
jgi:hypothetical protein